MGNRPEKMTFCAFIRHGESVDEVLSPTRVIPRSETKDSDPPLTKIGVAQSIITGQYLKEYFDNILMPTEIVIRTSPFINSIMTACAIASQLGGKIQPTVEIDSSNVDVLLRGKFDSNPLPDLEIYGCHSSQDIENLKRKYKIDQKVEIKFDKSKTDLTKNLYPEKQEDGLLRLIRYWIKTQKVNNSEKSKERTAVINVSHGMQVSWASAVEELVSEESSDSQKLEKMLDQLQAKDKDGKRLQDDFISTLKNLIASKMQPLDQCCTITASLESEDQRELVFYCLRSHLRTKLAVEQTKFLAGIKK